MSETLLKVLPLVSAGRVRISQHGLQELADDAIAPSDVIAGVECGRVVEDYPLYAKGPCVLCLQLDKHGKPIHVFSGLAAKSPDVATVITAYRPDPDRWHDDLVTRKPR